MINWGGKYRGPNNSQMGPFDWFICFLMVSSVFLFIAWAGGLFR